MTLAKPKRTRKWERAALKRTDAKVQHIARMLVFNEDERCRFPFEATTEHPCSGEDELCHMGDYSKAATRNQDPEDRHNPLHLMRMCAGHHKGPYSYDGSIGGKRFTIVPMTDKEFRGPCRFIDLRTRELIGIN